MNIMKGFCKLFKNERSPKPPEYSWEYFEEIKINTYDIYGNKIGKISAINSRFGKCISVDNINWGAYRQNVHHAPLWTYKECLIGRKIQEELCKK